MKPIYCFVFVFALIHLNVFSQPDNTHKKLLIQALEHNQQIRQAALEYEKQLLEVKEAKSVGLPSIQGSLNIKDFLKMPVTIIPGEVFGSPEDIEGALGKPHTLDAGFSFSQTVFNRSLKNGIKAAESSVELYSILKIQNEQDVIYQLSKAYYTYLTTLENLKTLEENQKLLENNKAITESFLQHNMALPSDIKRIDVKISEVKNQRNLARNSLQAQKHNINLLIGKEGDYLPNSIDSIQVNSLNSLNYVSDLTKRTELQTLNQMQVVNTLNLEKEKAANYPTISVFGNYMFNAQRDEFNYFNMNEKWKNSAMIGLKMDVPIFAGGRNNARIKQAKVDYLLTESKIEEAKLAIAQEYKIASDKYQTYQQNCKTLHENIHLTEDVYRVSFLKYKEGILSLTDLLDAEFELTNSKLKYSQSQLDLCLAELDVLKASGELQLLIKQ